MLCLCVVFVYGWPCGVVVVVCAVRSVVLCVCVRCSWCVRVVCCLGFRFVFVVWFTVCVVCLMFVVCCRRVRCSLVCRFCLVFVFACACGVVDVFVCFVWFGVRARFVFALVVRGCVCCLCFVACVCCMMCSYVLALCSLLYALVVASVLFRVSVRGVVRVCVVGCVLGDFVSRVFRCCFVVVFVLVLCCLRVRVASVLVFVCCVCLRWCVWYCGDVLSSRSFP